MQDYTEKRIIKAIEITEMLVQHGISRTEALKTAMARCEDIFQVYRALNILKEAMPIYGPNYMTEENIFAIVSNSSHARNIAMGLISLKPEFYANIANRILIINSESVLKEELARCINLLSLAGILEEYRDVLTHADWKLVRFSAKMLPLLHLADFLTKEKFRDLIENQQFLPGMCAVLERLPPQEYWRIWDSLCEYASIFNEATVKQSIETAVFDRKTFEKIILMCQTSSKETIANNIQEYLSSVDREIVTIPSGTGSENSSQAKILGLIRSSASVEIFEREESLQQISKGSEVSQIAIAQNHSTECKQVYFAPGPKMSDSNPSAIVESQPSANNNFSA
jgi:hypothetical protein